MNINNKIMTTSVASSNCFGYLELIIGPMYSGKTSEILKIYKQCNFCNIPVSIINHTIDKRYHDTMVSNHDKIMAPCLQGCLLEDIWSESENLRNSEVILINEGQFFPDLYNGVVNMLNNNKKVYVCGLDGDFERKKFGAILDLIPLCDKVVKLTSLCSLCKDGTPGIFSMRLTNELEQTVVGSENYIPVCRKCYNRKI
jgi:thymidine kinase